jgi:hypothetical protein
VARYRSKIVEIDAWQFMPGAGQPGWLHGDGVVRYSDHYEITTLEGVMRANVGDWIIRGTEGELYPCKPSVFERKYEAVE